MYEYVTIKFKTSLSNVFFYETDDNDRFDEWFNEELQKVGLYDWQITDHPTGIPDISELGITIGEFSTYDHNLYVTVQVDNVVLSYEELADNQQLLDYIERNIAPQVITELNNLLSGISLPMRDGTDFYKMKFDENEFYCLLGYSEKYGYYPSGNIKNTPFLIEDDYEVYV